MMRNSLLIIFFLLFCFSEAQSQSIVEREIVAIDSIGDVNVYEFSYHPPSGSYAYAKYNSSKNKYSIVSNKGPETGLYDYVSAPSIFFDSFGNFYTIAVNYVDSITTEHSLIANGNVIETYADADSYGTMMTKNDKFKFIVKDADGYKVASYNINDGISKSRPFTVVKQIYSADSAFNYHGDESPLPYFKDKNGDMGFIGTDGSNAYILLGENEIRTNYFDIDNYSFKYDKYGNLIYIGKYGSAFGEQPGREVLVQGDKEYKEFDYVSIPILLTKDNTPVYTAMTRTSGDLYYYNLVKGNEIQKLKNAKDIASIDGGIYFLTIDDNDNISYVASYSSGSLTSPEYKAAIVRNNVPSEISKDAVIYKMFKDKLLATTVPQGSEKQSLVLVDKNGSKIISDRKYDFFADAGFDPKGNIYYIGANYGNYEAKTKDKFDVYLNGKLLNTYDGIVYMAEGEGNGFSAINFDSKNGYLFTAVEQDMSSDTYNSYSYIVTQKGKQYADVNTSLGKDFQWIENLIITEEGNIFYTGGFYDEPANKTTLYPVFENKHQLYTYSSINFVNYDKIGRNINFISSRDNKFYEVTVKY